MTDKKGKIWLGITVVFAVCLTVFYLGNVVTKPWRIIPTLGGDGIKNIFTYLYHSMYGTGYWFQGMNYPYGEHITYTDGQPLLSVLFTSLHNVSAGTALCVLWSLIGLSYVVCVAYLYKILVHFRVAPLVAMIFAGLICIFSPQTFRIAGHYALAYMHVIPMLFYWTIKYNERPALRYSIYVFILVLLMAFLHLYFVAVSLVWVLCYALGYFLFVKDGFRSKLAHVLPLLAGIIAVFGIMAVVMRVTDPLRDRPAIPYGTLTYTTHKKDIISSPYSPFWLFAQKHKMVPRISEGGEGYTYPGLVILGIAALSVFTGLILLYRNRPGDLVVSRNGFSPIWLFIAFCALLLGMGAPFIWHMEWLLDYMSFLRQFRTLGRFSWIFYYIISVYGVIILYTWYTRLSVKRGPAIAYTLLLCPLLVWGYEATGYLKFQKDVSDPAMYNYEMMFSKLDKSWDEFLAENHHRGADFQAVLLLPFFHIGTEKLWLDGGWEITLGSKAALQLRLPMVDVMMSRSSWSQACKQVKIAAGPYADKPMLRDIKSDKPFLLLHFEDDSLSPDQQYLLGASDYIGRYSQCQVYACYPARIVANDKMHADSINSILPFISSTDTCIADKGEWYVDHMDSRRADDLLFGSGAAPCIKEDTSVIAVIPVKPIADSQKYEFSCWFLLTDKDYTSPDMALISYDAAGKPIDTNVMAVKWSVDNHGMWFRGAVYFPIRSNCRSIQCRLDNRPNPSYKMMDEMLLRPADAVIISKDKAGRVMVNNHLLKKGR